MSCRVTQDNKIFVYGISDKKVGGIDLQKPDGNVAPVSPAALGKNVPEPFKSEPKGGGGNRMHHKFVVIDFDKPTARVYLGSYNFSSAADTKNGGNLLLNRPIPSRNPMKVGRNDPCPCGSGRKYKKCCGAG